MKKILIGTGNKAKLDTYKQLLAGLNLEIVSSKDLNISEPEENAATQEQEAINKAKFYFEKTGLPSLVDDGVFEIEALNGEPGLKSKRWIGREMTDEEIIAEVFKRMAGQTNRNCQHKIVMALATPWGIFTADGEIKGVIPEKPSDTRYEHYPYRSVMYLPNYQKYWGELTEQEEEILSHRGHALEKLQDVLKELSK
jgi:XTP/dITP diphosphohydrolase